jgi:hypothetical protein
MTEPGTPFRRAWITAGHSDLWKCQGTYCTVPYEYLPRLSRATDDLGWLDDVSPGFDEAITLHSSDNDLGNLEGLVAEAKSLALALPEPFLRFIRTPDLQDKVPTCTACFLALSDHLVPIPAAEGYFLLRFLNDSQSCFMWYLCLGGKGEPGVVASGYFLEPDIFDVMEYEGVKREDIFREALTCAETFTEFLYRFWIENTIWYSLHKRLPLTPIQEEYRNQIVRKL